MYSESIPTELLFQPYSEGKLRCHVCPKACILTEGETGYCGIRKYVDNKIISKTYGQTTGLAVDPIEKKPLYHFLPGTETLSLGGIGCNLACKHCQNASTSQARNESALSYLEKASPKKVVQTCLDRNLPSISVTYNEPTINTEYVVDIAGLAHEHDLKVIAVTNGFLTRPISKYLGQFLDAANVDFKGDKEFYRSICDGRQTPVKHCIEEWVEAGVHIELTTLVIPGLNDNNDFTEQTMKWVLEKLGSDIPIHFSKFHPQYQMLNRPSTPEKTLFKFRRQTLDMGLKYVYTGNIRDDESGTTYCFSCKTPLIRRGAGSFLRRGYGTEFVNYDSQKNICTKCKSPAPFLN
ncbi:MAG: AmmeMemoRadiSam system radical SAM enzyme [Candidatus Hodarchaeales archaeon]|jgi:pyruvate formate lyase activating enzyme